MSTVREVVASIAKKLEECLDPMEYEFSVGIDPYATPIEGPSGRLTRYHGSYPLLQKPERDGWAKQIRTIIGDL